MKNIGLLVAASVLTVACTNTQANHHAKAETAAADLSGAVCEGYGPQTPRDISSKVGLNTVNVPVAPDASEMNLCNIHFHNAAEHKGPGFSIEVVGDGKGYGDGFQCGISKQLTAAERAPFEGNMCKGVQPGDTIEVHWVHTTCDVNPGPTLGACLSEQCANPSLRVQTQVFTVVNDDSAIDFADYATLVKNNGYNQAAALPTGFGDVVEFSGSTTGPSFNEQTCSPIQATWNVNSGCAKVSIASLSKWCESNVFDENKAHGVRKLVTDPRLLSPID